MPSCGPATSCRLSPAASTAKPRAGGIQAEAGVGVAQRLRLQAQTALSSYAEPEWARAEGWPAFADRLLELARAAAGGSGPQPAVVKRLWPPAVAARPLGG